MRRIFGFAAAGLFLTLVLLRCMPVSLAADRANARDCLYYTYEQPDAGDVLSLGSVNQVRLAAQEEPDFGYFACTLLYGGDSSARLLERLGASVVWEQELEGMRILYAYSPRISDSVPVQDRHINLQIVVRAHDTLAGSPLIVGSY